MIRFILADLRRLWPGALAVVLLVAFATALGVTVTLQERAMRLGSARAADKFDLVIGAAGSETQLVLSSVFLQASALPLMSGDVLSRLVDDPRVDWAAPVGFGDSFEGQPIVGTSTQMVDYLSSGFAEGHTFQTENEAVIGSAVRMRLGSGFKPVHGGLDQGGHTHTELSYTVVGKMKPTGTAWDRAILVPIRSVWSIHGLEHDDHSAHRHEDHLDENFSEDVFALPAIVVKPKTIADAYKLRQDYRTGDTLAVFPAEVLTRLYSTLGDARTILAVVASAAQLLVASALIFVAVVHIGQRRRQIGALRALGAPRLSVVGIIWLELFVLLIAGIALGFALGFGAALVITHLIFSWSGVLLPVEFIRKDAGLALTFVAFAAVLGLIPGLLAYRQSPAIALRG